MALLIIILLLWLMFYLARIGKKDRVQDKLTRQSASDSARADAERQRSNKEIDDQITIILPTIRNE